MSLTPIKAGDMMIPAEEGLFFVSSGNMRRVKPANRSIIREGESFILTAAYDACGDLSPLEVTVNSIIHPGELSGRSTMLLLTDRASGGVLGTVSIGYFMAALPEELPEPF